MPILYVKHPVSSQLKEELLAKYPRYSFLDLKFKPENISDGDVVVGDEPPKRKQKRTLSDK